MRSLSTAQEEIKNFCEKRGVFELLHFVKVEQMPFILRYGLLTNAILRNAGGTIEDHSRIDRNSDHVCLSIDFPNYKLFYKRRMANTREIWCILSIRKSLIWERPCIFFPSNAARNNGRDGKRGLTGIQAIYAASIGGIERSPLIKDSLPTEPQAEVLLPDPVTPEEIEKVYFSNSTEARINESIIVNAGKQIQIREDLFLPRKDWDSWKRMTGAEA